MLGSEYDRDLWNLYRAAKKAAEFVLIIFRALVAGLSVDRELGRVERLVAQVLEDAAMELIRSAFGGSDDLRSG